ncbi:hypothetical protein M2298_004885 [Brevibacillus sp. 1238]|nr:hypothetical protein [Brevibacillus sp. 1238]
MPSPTISMSGEEDMYMDCEAFVQIVRLSPLLGDRRLIVWLCQSPMYCDWLFLLILRTSRLR